MSCISYAAKVQRFISHFGFHLWLKLTPFKLGGKIPQEKEIEHSSEQIKIPLPGVK